MRIGIASELLEEYSFERNDPVDLNRDLVSQFYLDSIVTSIQRLGYSTEWIGDAHSILANYASSSKDWDYGFNLAEGVRSQNRASAVPMLLELLEIPYLGSDAFVQSLALNKYQVGLAARDLGIPIPETIVVYDPQELRKRRALRFPLIAKPIH